MAKGLAESEGDKGDWIRLLLGPDSGREALRKLDGGYLKEHRYVRDTASGGKGELKGLLRSSKP